MNLPLLQTVLAMAVTVGIVYKLIPLLVKVAYFKDLYDKPDGERKLHDRYITYLGGVAIFIGLFIGFSLSGYAGQLQGFEFLSVAMIALFFTGLKDDLMGLSPSKKLAIELFAAVLLIAGCGAMISNFHGMFGIESIPVYVSIPVTIFTVIVVMNSFNLIDGIDGLAGGIGMIASLFLAAGFYSAGYTALMLLAIFTAVSLFGFLMHNFHPARIFMGDTGSLVVGLLLAFLTINYLGLSGNTEYAGLYHNASVILPVAFLAIPLYDTLTVFVKRLARGDGPFTPGKDHVHHQLLDMGFSQKQTTVFLYLVTILIGLLAISLSGLNNNLILGVIVLFMVSFLPTNGYKRSILKKLGIFDLDRHKQLQDLREERRTLVEEKERPTRQRAGQEKELA
ncbi:MraY family glycosyltransferase [Rhodohalobacter mucosus]|uniref:Undecaprenyl/decaprenyl-phosphate alpha-N-acetylglucosaminyl 1-phosphate transferase n=1 Tax=Rhodohalobacter mucosus TaxID=2079485 RepID=A0A316TSS4_9BACT|nr:MraY family glycosyltransferase [Rhodohalobacter mucosus]PWN07470.1 undecaprenyl/decaprenyl-phosphate alpha-N-acetylglucosaminyl 1-phosphate transferase [Rhodohalobacter mucosus]